MPVPHQEMRRIIKRRIRGLEGTERVRMLKACLAELPGYYQGPYGQIRRWVSDLIAEAETRKAIQHQESFFLPKQGAAQIVLVGPPNAGKSSLLKALTGRQVAVGNYPFTTLRPVEGMVVFDGAKIQLVDLPGLLEGAADGKGGGRAALAAIRMADAALEVVPLSPEGLSQGLLVEAELHREGMAIPTGIVATKSDLDGAGAVLADLRAARPEQAIVACSVITGDGLDEVRRLVWDLSGLIRVFCKPRGGAVSRQAMVLPFGASVEMLTVTLNRAWLGRCRSAHVTGTSAKFPEQQVGLDHVLQDGDIVELVID